MAKAALEAGKHVLLEKPIAITLDEADELIALAEAKVLKFTIGYSQRFNPKQALVKRSLNDGTLGEPVSALVSRHITRNLGQRSVAGSSCHRRRWRRPTTSTSRCGASSRAGRFGSTRRRPASP